MSLMIWCRERYRPALVYLLAQSLEELAKTTYLLIEALNSEPVVYICPGKALRV